jgi:hypothetical protein
MLRRFTASRRPCPRVPQARLFPTYIETFQEPFVPRSELHSRARLARLRNILTPPIKRTPVVLDGADMVGVHTFFPNSAIRHSVVFSISADVGRGEEENRIGKLVIQLRW